MKATVERRLADFLAKGPAPYSRGWIDEASALVAEVALCRKSFQRVHRRAQRGEALAHREGKRADSLARQLRRLLTSPGKC